MWEADQNGAIFCCGTKGDESIEKYGFVKGHAYTVVNFMLFRWDCLITQKEC